MKFVRLRRIFAAALLLGMTACTSGGDFENRYAADAGDILYASDTAAALTETVEDAAAEETELAVTETETDPPVIETEPETESPVVETEPETAPPVVETEPETVPPVLETEPETAPPTTKPEPGPAPHTTDSAAVPDGTTFVCNTSSGKYHLPDCGSVAKIKPENITYLTCAEAEIPVTFAPCNVCLADSAAVRKTQIPAATAGEVSYILNTNTEKFHAPTCKSVMKIKAENYAEFTGTRDEAIAAGYDPCGNCKP